MILAMLWAVEPAAPRGAWLAVLSSIGTAGVTALGLYLLARHQRSGRTGTSEAETLWGQAQQMRQEQREEIAYLRGKVEQMDAKIDRLLAEIAVLKQRRTR